MRLNRLLPALALSAACAAAAHAQDAHKGHKHEHKAADKAGQKAGQKSAADKADHAGHEGHGRHGAPPAGAANVTLAPGEVAQRGEPIGAGAVVDFASLLKEPAKYAGQTVIVEGVVERVCQKQGCWMELAPEKGARGVRVQMKDHAFAVPFNSAGLRARAEGVFTLKTLSKEDADHFEREGAKLRRNADGTADELSFTATGVELTRK